MARPVSGGNGQIDMRIAILADIHGNLPALEAVVNDLQRQRPDQVCVAGDLINRCPWSNQVLDLVAAAEWRVLAGNHELVVQMLGAADCPPPLRDRERFADLWWTRGQLTPEHLAELARLPIQLHIATHGLPTIQVVHGVPGDPFVGFAPDMTDAQLARYLVGETDEQRQQTRDEVLGTTAADFRAFADVLDAVRREGRVVVLGSAEALAAANAERSDFLNIQRVL